MGAKAEILQKFQGNWLPAYERFLNFKRNGKELFALCPFHNDSTPSLTVEPASGKFYCHGCKTGGDFFKFYALKNGLSLNGGFREVLEGICRDFGIQATEEHKHKSNGKTGTISKIYDYTDQDGNLLFQVCRFEPKDFRQRRPDGQGGWIWSVKDIELVPYHLPELLKAEEILVCEGEKDVETARRLGFTATCNAQGAGKWRAEYADYLQGKRVVLIPDNDECGRKHMSQVAKTLEGKAASVRWLDLADDWPGLPEKADLSDWAEHYGDDASAAERLAIFLDGAEEYKPVSVEVEPEPAPGQENLKAKLWNISQEKNLQSNEKQRKSAQAVVQWLHQQGHLYYYAARRDFESSMYFNTTSKELVLIQSDYFQAWLAESMGVNRAERLFSFTQAAIETEALSERATGIEPSVYWAAKPGAVYLSNGPGRVVKITGGNINEADNGIDGALFPVGATLEPWALTDPQNPFEKCALFRDMATAAEHGKTLFMLFACSLPLTPANKPPLTLVGDVGSGKTKTGQGLFELYGMPARITALQKNGEVDFWVALEAGGLSVLDNADTRIDWLADAIAAAATGGSLERRRLYKNIGTINLRPRSWLIITSANPTFGSDAGLADRLLVVRLKRRTGETAESRLSDEIREHRNAGLSFIAQTLSKALADTRPTPAGLNARHPDFAAMAVKLGRAMGHEREAIEALRAAESDKSRFNIECDYIGQAMLELLSDKPFSGTAENLLNALIKIDSSLDGKLSVKRLGKRLAKLWPHLQVVFQATQEKDAHTRCIFYRFKGV